MRVASHEVRGWKLNGWVDVPYNFQNLGGGPLVKARGSKNLQKLQFDSPPSPFAIIIKYGRVLADFSANDDLFFFYWGLMLLCLMGVRFENTCTVSGKWNEDPVSVQDFIFCFCVWCKSRELRGTVHESFV